MSGVTIPTVAVQSLPLFDGGGVEEEQEEQESSEQRAATSVAMLPNLARLRNGAGASTGGAENSCWVEGWLAVALREARICSTVVRCASRDMQRASKLLVSSARSCVLAPQIFFGAC